MPAKLKALPVYENLGEIEIEHANDMNVPVSIFLAPAEYDEGAKVKTDYGDTVWELRASNYMPRKGVVVEDSYRAQSTDREVLAALVRKHWLPLYLAAVETLALLVPDEDDAAGLHYWKRVK